MGTGGAEALCKPGGPSAAAKPAPNGGAVLLSAACLALTLLFVLHLAHGGQGSRASEPMHLAGGQSGAPPPSIVACG